jgi:cellulose synthase/poly-beta-1,6-N-acetylglucosamine synthase-like glycosyltransferase
MGHKMLDKISLLIPIYNEDVEIVELAIQSVAQKYNSIDIEIIIGLDNYSSLVPELYYYLSKLSNELETKVIFFCNESNIGLAATLNKAFDKSSGNFIARMDADDISSKDRLLLQYNYLTKNDYDFVFSDALFFSSKLDTTETYRYDYYKIKERYTNKSLLNFDYAFHTSWFLKRDVFESIGKYRNLEVSQDYDFLLRVLFRGYRLGFIRQPLVKIRVRQGSITNKKSYRQFLVSKSLLRLYRNNRLFDNDEIDKINLILANISSTYEIAVNRFIDTYRLKNFFIMQKWLILLKLIMKHPKIISFLIYKMNTKIKFLYYVFMSKLSRRFG